VNVEELLQEKDIYFIPKGNDLLVGCLSPEHSDRSPSMRIDRITGIFHCFSCGFKGNLFNLYGEIGSPLQARRELLRRKIQEKMSSSVGMSLPTGSVPYTGSWRGLQPDTYRKFEAFQHHDPSYVGRIVFPVKDISGKIVAFNGRHTSGAVPKYMITPAGAKMPLYPKVTGIKNAVILVEGIYDMLNLHDKGLTNAVCCFGTNNISVEKLSMLSMQGIAQIDIFFDGDDAGQKAVEKVKEMCEKASLLSRNVHLSGTDPGALSKPQIEKLKRKLYG